jgi:hypothetical protein
VFAVTTVLPLSLKDLFWVTAEIQITQNVAPVLALNRALSRSEESPLVFVTEYSHCCNSLRIWTALKSAAAGGVVRKAVLRANHGLYVSGETYVRRGSETGENSTIP